MKRRTLYTKILAAALLLLAVNFSFGAYSGSSYDDHSSKFSLKNLGAFSKTYSLAYLRFGNIRFVGTQQVSEQKQDSTVQVQSMMRIQRGNTTFVYPYTYRVRVPKFKTPAPPSATYNH
ncbi:MAG TPA: hypothetical protein VG738_08295 [Chitinophagaceae bacterium]|nr:hypothetical protein [Chitinophagaceae bacterium]